MGFTPDADFPVIYGEKGGLHVRLKGDVQTCITSMHAGERPNIVIGKASLCVDKWNDAYMDMFDFYLKSNGLKGSVAYDGKQAVLTMEGVSAHAAMPYNGVNAGLHLLNFVGSAMQDKFAYDTYAPVSYTHLDYKFGQWQARYVRSNGRSNIRSLCWQIRMYKH